MAGAAKTAQSRVHNGRTTEQPGYLGDFIVWSVVGPQPRPAYALVNAVDQPADEARAPQTHRNSNLRLSKRRSIIK